MSDQQFDQDAAKAYGLSTTPFGKAMSKAHADRATRSYDVNVSATSRSAIVAAVVAAVVAAIVGYLAAPSSPAPAPATTTTVAVSTTVAPAVFTPTATNTGVPAGTTLTKQGATTFTSADNGKVVTGVEFTGRVTFSGASNLTIRNSKMDAQDVFLISGSGTNVLLDQVTIDGGNWTQDNFGFQTSGVTYRHLRTMRLGNIGRAMTNTVIDGLYADQPTTTVDGAHVDGIEISGNGTGGANNILIKDAVIAYPKGFTWGPSTNQGGLTSAINITTDFGPISGVTIQHVVETGGAFTQYIREVNGYTIRNVTFNDVVIDGWLYGPISIDTGASISAWSNVRNNAGAAVPRP